MRQKLILKLQEILRQRYNKHIVEIRDPFRDMKVLLAGMEISAIVDAGAHHGEFALEFARVFPRSRIYSFEPYSHAFDVLSGATKFLHNITPLQFALSSDNGTQTLYINMQDSTNALSPTGDMGRKYQSWQTENISTENVNVITLDEWGQQNNITAVDLLKMDVQGFELHVLKGALNYLASSVRLIYTEVEFVKIYEENCLYYELESYLRELGFELFQFYNLTSGNDGQLVTGDAIFIKRGKVAF